MISNKDNYLLDLVKIERSIYYNLDGRWGTLCDKLEAPNNYLKKVIKDDTISIVARIALSIFLGLPALVGSAISNLIYRFKGEKIKDYNQEIKEFNHILSPDTAGAYGLMTIIDGLIRNRIKANDCKTDLICNWPYKQNNSVRSMLYIDEAERTLLDTRFVEADKKKIVFIQPERKGDGKSLSEKFGGTTHDKISAFWIAKARSTTTIKNSTFIWIDPHKPIDRKFINQIKSILTQPK
jgi:hypothetical protein